MCTRGLDSSLIGADCIGSGPIGQLADIADREVHRVACLIAREGISALTATAPQGSATLSWECLATRICPPHFASTSTARLSSIE